MNKRVLLKHIKQLSMACHVHLDPRYEFMVVKDFWLPPGYNWRQSDVLIEIPEGYPDVPPGLGGDRIYFPEGLRYQGNRPLDYHEGFGPPGWAWWCYERIDWVPWRDNLLTLLETLRAHLTNPPC